VIPSASSAAQQDAAAGEPQRVQSGLCCRLALNTGAPSEPRRRCGSQLSARSGRQMKRQEGADAMRVAGAAEGC
jgi:hypothetical protein